MKTGLYFGSFNPIHTGHLIIASHIAEFTDLNEIWFVISPQNPFKKKTSLLHDFERMKMVELAIEGDKRFGISDIEFRMPKPSYTIDTLTYLKELHPSREFAIIMGSDTLHTFLKWKNALIIQSNYQRYVYPRPGYDFDPSEHQNVVFVDAPRIEISSTFIRKAIRENHDIRYLLPPKVYDYIKKMNFYEK